MKSKDRTWVYISLLTLATALIWLGISVRSTLIKSTVPENVQKLITPLNPNLDQGVIDNLKSRTDQ